MALIVLDEPWCFGSMIIGYLLDDYWSPTSAHAILVLLSDLVLGLGLAIVQSEGLDPFHFWHSVSFYLVPPWSQFCSVARDILYMMSA